MAKISPPAELVVATAFGVTLGQESVTTCWEIMMDECHRCHSDLYTCPVCHGDGKVPYTFGECTECNGTGKLCPKDGKHWND
jgi:RecJ-like exonuclease